MNLPFALPAERRFDVLGFGTNAVDYLITVDEFPRFAGKAAFDTCTIAPGGEVASTVYALARLGMKTAYVGAFGGDEAGVIGRASLADADIDLSGSRIVEDAATQIAFIIIDKASGERTILWKRDPRLAIPPDEVPLAMVGEVRILHMTPHDVSACVALAREARSKSTIVSLDIDNVFEGVEELLPLVDICIASEDLPARLTGIADLDEALETIRTRFGSAVVGATLGDKGSVVLAGDEYIRTRAYEVPGRCMDTTGAGDAFRAGFLFGVLSGQTIEVCCRAANAAAALKCRRLGARDGLPDKAELKTMLKKV